MSMWKYKRETIPILNLSAGRSWSSSLDSHHCSFTPVSLLPFQLHSTNALSSLNIEPAVRFLTRTFLSPNQQCQSTEGKISHSMDLLTPNSPGGLPTLCVTTNSSWLPWGGLPCLSSAPWCLYPSGVELLTHIFSIRINILSVNHYRHQKRVFYRRPSVCLTVKGKW